MSREEWKGLLLSFANYKHILSNPTAEHSRVNGRAGGSERCVELPNLLKLFRSARFCTLFRVAGEKEGDHYVTVFAFTFFRLDSSQNVIEKFAVVLANRVEHLLLIPIAEKKFVVLDMTFARHCKMSPFIYWFGKTELLT